MLQCNYIDMMILILWSIKGPIFDPKKGPQKNDLFLEPPRIYDSFAPIVTCSLHYNQNCRGHVFVVMAPILWGVSPCAIPQYVVNLARLF
jgi:hypothetical protein